MEKHSKIAVVAFALSMSLFSIIIIVFIGTIVSIHYGIGRHSHIVVGLLGPAILIYASGFLAALWLNINALYQRGRSKILPIIGLSSQGLILFAVLSMVWIKSKPPTISGASIVEYGEYHATIMGSTVTDDSTHSKVTLFKDILLLKKADTVRASIGKTFGFRYVVHGYPVGKNVTIKVVYLYPSPGLVDQKLHTVKPSTYRILSQTLGDTGWVAFTFDHEWELIPGNWSFQIWPKDRKLVEKVFSVLRK
jgi:hypothetical protein